MAPSLYDFSYHDNLYFVGFWIDSPKIGGGREIRGWAFEVDLNSKTARNILDDDLLRKKYGYKTIAEERIETEGREILIPPEMVQGKN